MLAAEISERRPDWWAGLAPERRDRRARRFSRPGDRALPPGGRAGERPALARSAGWWDCSTSETGSTRSTAWPRCSATRESALDEITIVKALDAIRKQDFDRGIALARQVFPETSTNSSDHLTLGRFYIGRRTERRGRQGIPTRRGAGPWSARTRG